VELNYVVGDATEPIQRPGAIVHVCNDIGAWGSGFVLAVSDRWTKPKEVYTTRYMRSKVKHLLTPQSVEGKLGDVQWVIVEEDLCVVNLIAQEGTNRHIRAVRYDALDECLRQMYWQAKEWDISVHMPRIGAGLGGGNWTIIEAIIKANMTVPTFVYDLP
jgi:O-acetyl-ADP-ribose deacetylase (regulator of RNase III)